MHTRRPVTKLTHTVPTNFVPVAFSGGGLSKWKIDVQGHIIRSRPQESASPPGNALLWACLCTDPTPGQITTQQHCCYEGGAALLRQGHPIPAYDRNTHTTWTEPHQLRGTHIAQTDASHPGKGGALKKKSIPDPWETKTKQRTHQELFVVSWERKGECE